MIKIVCRTIRITTSRVQIVRKKRSFFALWPGVPESNPSLSNPDPRRRITDGTGSADRHEKYEMIGREKSEPQYKKHSKSCAFEYCNRIDPPAERKSVEPIQFFAEAFRHFMQIFTFFVEPFSVFFIVLRFGNNIRLFTL